MSLPEDEPPAGQDQDQTATAFSSFNNNPPQIELVSNSSKDIEFDNRTSITTAELPDKVCTHCLEDNLIRAGVIDTFVICQKCSEEFCLHGASKLDPQYCIHCCNDFKVVDVIEAEQRPIINAKGEITAVRQFKVRHITLSGLHWLFFNRAIATLSDVELEHAIEYHMSIYHGMIYEREARRVKKSQRNRGKHAINEVNPLDGSISQPFVTTQDGVKFATVNSNGGKPKKVRTRTVKVSQSSTGSSNSKAPSQDKINELVRTLMAAGFSPDQIAAIGKK